MGEVASRYGKIDGIIHGAGVLRDGLLSQMTPDDFSMVTDVKFLGAWNLFSAAEEAGLRFFVGLSSVAAIQGNPGQTNYAAANRMMSALIRTLRRKNGAIRFKALMLPPIEGAGMAEDPEVRELMRRKGAAYIHVNELAGLFCRELFVAPADDDWVMFMRTLPSVKTARLNDTTRPSPSGELDGGAVSFSPEDFPMIEGISCLDIRREQLEAFRSFSREKDLWIADHRPFKFVKHPLVSAAMVLETFMEAARILYPHLQVRGVRQVRFLDMIQCPPGIPRPSRISCRRVGNGLREVLCEVSLATQEISPTGRLTDRFTPHCQGQVILDGGGGYLGEGFPDFPVRLDELRTRPMDHKKMLEWYKDRSGLKGRYRVMEFLDGAGPGVVRGRTTYRETSDFANLRERAVPILSLPFRGPFAVGRLLHRCNGPIGATIHDSHGDRGDEVFAKMPGGGTDNPGGPHAGAGRAKASPGTPEDLTIKAAPSCRFRVCGCTGFRTEPSGLRKDRSGKMEWMWQRIARI